MAETDSDKTSPPETGSIVQSNRRKWRFFVESCAKKQKQQQKLSCTNFRLKKGPTISRFPIQKGCSPKNPTVYIFAATKKWNPQKPHIFVRSL